MFAGLLERARAITAQTAAQFNKTDDLERICLAAAGAIFADGKAEDEEYEAALKTIRGRFDVAFSTRQIEAALAKATKMFEAGRFSGKRAVFQAMSSVETAEEGEAIFAVVLDIADSAGGGIGESEMPYIRELAQKLRVNMKAYGLEDEDARKRA